MPSPAITIVIGDQSSREEKIISSPMKLMVGGRAMFVRLVIIHHAAISGKIIWAPCSSSSARL